MQSLGLPKIGEQDQNPNHNLNFLLGQAFKIFTLVTPNLIHNRKQFLIS